MKQRVILGPPGCGKTTYLLNRVQDEMADGVHPSRIAYVSFTRKATEEARSRALLRFNATVDDFPFFKTLHALAYQQLGLNRAQVMGRAQYRTLGEALGLVFSDYMDFEDGSVPMSAKNGDMARFITGMARATLTPLEDQFKKVPIGNVGWFQVKQFSDTLERFKTDTGMIDFPDMLDSFVTQCNPLDVDVAFIDEAQDLSKQQWRMLRHALQRVQRVYIAGDDDQAIFKWSGADVESFLSLEGERIVLDQSYRLPRAVHAAVELISSRISRRYPKAWRSRDDAGSVHHLPQLHQIEWDRSIDASGKMPTYLLLARNRYLLEQYEQFVRASGVPYSIGTRSSLDKSSVEAIKLWEYLRPPYNKALPAADVRLVYSKMRCGEGLARGHKTLKGVTDDTLLTLADLKRDHGLQREDVWHDALTMIPVEDREFMVACLRRKEKITAVPRVHISTVHGVKGGEADHVVMLSDMAGRTYAESRIDPDDEHRVAYVAASRARQSLTIILPQTPRAYDFP